MLTALVAGLLTLGVVVAFSRVLLATEDALFRRRIRRRTEAMRRQQELSAHQPDNH